MKTALACVVLLTHAAFCEEPLAQSARARVVEFCETELKGDHAKRVEYFQNSLRDKSAVDFANEPVDLISGYKVLSVEIKGNTAKVVVVYDLIGELKNVRYSGYPGLKVSPGTWIDRADKLVAKRNQSFHQTISLVLEPVSQRWFISKPQIPRVSRKAVLDLLHKEINEKQETLKKNKGEALPHIEASLNWDLNKVKLLEGMGPLSE